MKNLVENLKNDRELELKIIRLIQSIKEQEQEVKYMIQAGKEIIYNE